MFPFVGMPDAMDILEVKKSLSISPLNEFSSSWHKSEFIWPTSIKS